MSKNNSPFSFANRAHHNLSYSTANNPAVNRPVETVAAQKQGVEIKDIADHLHPVYEQLDWSGQDLDALKRVTQLETAALLGQLMELELLGLIVQQGGRYLRV